MAWITRGLRRGVLTSSYPARPDGYETDFRSCVVVSSRPVAADAIEAVMATCPTGAIASGPTGLSLDRGRCILCARCVESLPDNFRFSSTVEVARLGRDLLIVPEGDENDEALARVRADLARRVKSLRRSLHVRHLDAGSDGADEWEVAALMNPIYDVQRLGVVFTASPRHADVLLVTGVASSGMVGPLQRTLREMPDPKVVIAAGVDAISGGLLRDSYASKGGVGSCVAVDIFVPGSPASPFALLHALVAATAVTRSRRAVDVARATNDTSKGVT